MTVRQRANPGDKKVQMNALNILLVDDDRILATTLSHGLRKAMGKEISVDACFSGSEALSLLATQAFDLVISDHHMPGMSGFELLNQIRRDHRKTILVLATAFGTDELENEAYKLGIGYIAKPFEMPYLVQLIQNLIRGNKIGEEKRTDSDGLLNRVMLDRGDPIV